MHDLAHEVNALPLFAGATVIIICALEGAVLGSRSITMCRQSSKYNEYMREAYRL